LFLGDVLKRNKYFAQETVLGQALKYMFLYASQIWYKFCL